MSGVRHRARRRAELSQHFLRSRALATSLVTQSSITRSDLVVEIGPGRGILTQGLAGRCRRLIAVELDERLYRGLLDTYCDAPHVVPVHDDFLRFPLPDDPYKVFASIPYSQTAAIVRRLASAPVPPRDGYPVVQLEAAERFAGGPYAPETQESLLLKPWWQVEIARRLRRTDFDPPPAVESVVLWLARRARPLMDPPPAYGRFVAASFGRRGNTLRRCLRDIFTGRQIGRLARDLRFDPGAAPSEIAFDQWLGLFRYLMDEGNHNTVGWPSRPTAKAR